MHTGIVKYIPFWEYILSYIKLLGVKPCMIQVFNHIYAIYYLEIHTHFY